MDNEKIGFVVLWCIGYIVYFVGFSVAALLGWL